MDYKQIYENWVLNVKDEEIKKELNEIKSNDKLIREKFHQNIGFGTGGLRGIIGAGTNNMNIYTVRWAAQGISDYINSVSTTPSIAISYDNRIKSDLFAKECAKVLAANNIKVYISKELQPTPFLSYMVRNLSCSGGIMITASHNPAIYNGLKAYNSDGAQFADKAAEKTYGYIKKLNMFTDIKIMDFKEALDNGTIEYLDDDVKTSYISALKKQSFFIKNNKKADNIVISYTPIHGTGLYPVQSILKEIGVNNLNIVEEQKYPDGTFPGTENPNPELPKTMELGIKLAEKTNSDILIGTDPDADRLGVAIKTDDGFKLLTGNEVGVLIFDYILKNTTHIKEDAYAVRSIVSTSLFDEIAKAYNVTVKTVLTGFKYIADFIKKLEDQGKEDNYIFGFEESCGYLFGTYVRDKDAVNSAMLIAEMASYYKTNNSSLFEVLNDIYSKYGYYYDPTLNYTYEGLEGNERIKDITQSLREDKIEHINNIKVVTYKDYLTEEDSEKDDLPKSDVVLMILEDGSRLTVRPSGTEPKIKFYYSIIAPDKEQAVIKADKYKAYIENKLSL